MLLSVLGRAQVLTLTDASSGAPLPGATLLSTNPPAQGVSDAQGQIAIAKFLGADTITIRCLGYQALRVSFFDLELARFRLALQPVALDLDQAVVVASRWQQRSSRVPQRISSIGTQEVLLQNPQTAADLLGLGGEVFIQKSQQGGGSPMIRGFSTNRLLYAVDGVRMNTAIFRSGNLQNVISLDPLAIAQTEVLFGAGAVLYGSDAIGAVMSFQTLRPQLRAERSTGEVAGRVLLRTATANQELTGHFDVQRSWDRVALLTSVSFNDFGDLRMGRHGPEAYLRPVYAQRQNNTDVAVANPDPLVQTPSGYQQVNLMQKVRYQPNARWNLEYGLHYSTTSDYSRYDRLIRLRNGLPRSGEFYYGPQVWQMGLLLVEHRAPRRWYDELALRLAQQFFEESRIDRDWNQVERRLRMEQVQAYSVNLDLTKRQGEKSQWFYGLEGVLNRVGSSGTNQNANTGVREPGPTRYPQADWSSLAAYLSHARELGARSTLQAGLRYNLFGLRADFSQNLPFYPFPFRESNNNDGALTGSLGWVLRLPRQWTFRINGSTAFRAPNVDDVGKVFDSTPGAVVVPNPAVKAEYAYSGELGLAKIFGEKLRVELTAYYTLLDQALVRRPFVLNGATELVYAGELSQIEAIQNAAQARVFGGQATLEWSLAPGWKLESTLNLQDGEEELDNGDKSPLRHAAPLFGRTQLTYQHRLLTLQLYALYQGTITYANLAAEGRATAYLFAPDGEGNPYAPAWHTLNAKLLFPLSATIQCSAGVENLTDQRYRPYSSGLAGAGRNVVLALSARF